MPKRVSPALVGAFVIGALAVLITTIMVVGSGQLFRKPLLFVCMFQGDLNGLKVGAPVKFRGVQIGSVVNIKLGLSPSEGRLKQNVTGLRLPVIVEIERSKIASRGGPGIALGQTGFEDFVKRGLRAQLSVESLLTGLLYIDLDLHPNAPLHLELEPGGNYREIPTIPTKLESVQQQAIETFAKFEQIDFKALAISITDAANSIKALTSSPDLKETLASLKTAAANLNTTIISMRRTLNHLDGRIDPLVASLQKNSVQVNATLAQTRASLVQLESTLDPEAPLAVHLNETLDQLTETSRSMGEFVDYLQRNPSSLIRGRFVPEKDR